MKALASRSVSLETMLGLLALGIPAGLLLLLLGRDRLEYVDNVTLCIVSAMSLLICAAIRINRTTRIAILNVFILNYVLFWHLRFLTLALLPEYELVLTRTVQIDREMFNDYSVVVFISLFAALTGIFLAHGLVQKLRHRKLTNNGAADHLKQRIKDRMSVASIYLAVALLYKMFCLVYAGRELPPVLSYMGFLFLPQFVLFIVLLIVFCGDVSKRASFLFISYVVAYVVVDVIGGNRSTLVFVLLYSLFLCFVFQKQLRFNYMHLIGGLLLLVLTFVSFTLGMFQRQISLERSVLHAESLEYIARRSSELDTYKAVETMLGLALARAGYLDFSAEIYANKRYDQAVNIVNVLKSAIDNNIPGDIFDDSRRIAYRLRDVYSPGDTDVYYQSDVVGAVAENYLLFGWGFPVAIAFAAFTFTVLFYACRANILGFFWKLILAIAVMNWWNSFGYDWLLMDFLRQLVFGSIVIATVFYVSPFGRRSTSIAPA